MARSQTKNEASKSNETMANACKDAESILRDEGYHVSFLSAGNDGVSCDSELVQNTLARFLSGKISYAALTDTNHNVKNLRCQLLGGGNSVKLLV